MRGYRKLGNCSIDKGDDVYVVCRVIRQFQKGLKCLNIQSGGITREREEYLDNVPEYSACRRAGDGR